MFNLNHNLQTPNPNHDLILNLLLNLSHSYTHKQNSGKWCDPSVDLQPCQNPSSPSVSQLKRTHGAAVPMPVNIDRGSPKQLQPSAMGATSLLQLLCKRDGDESTAEARIQNFQILNSIILDPRPHLCRRLSRNVSLLLQIAHRRSGLQ